MSEKVKLPSGIISCQYSVDGVDKGMVSTGDNILLKTGQTHRFYLDSDKGNLGEGTKDKTATSNHGKWAYLLSYLWDRAKQIKGKETYPSWGKVGTATENTSVEYFGIGQQYKLGSFIEFTPGDHDFWLGNSYHMEVFNNIPDKGFYFNFFPVNKPEVRFAYFDEQKFGPVDAMGINDGLYHYGQTIDLHVYTHLLPAKFSDKFNVATEKNFEDLTLEVILTDINGQTLLSEPIIKDKLSKFYVQENGTSANAEFKIPFFIDPGWKEKIHFKKDLEKDYSAIIKIKNVKTNVEYVHQLSTEKTLHINQTTKDVEEMKVSRYILVKYETAAAILKNFEVSKNNQIQYIGDINYTRKEFDPCGYSKITIKEGTRKPFDIFDEDAATIDLTTAYYDVITGDERKNIVIELGNLKNKGVMCTGVLLEKGQTHSDIHNVFQMHKVVTPFINENGRYVIEEDKSHVKQLKAAKIGVTAENQKDYDYKADPLKRSEDVARTQNFKENRDFNYAGDNLTLMPNYLYNKTFDAEVSKYIGFDGATVADDVMDKLWAFRYFFLSPEMSQKYFIPISTCRYPNQLARIRVFPDMEWKFSLSVGVGGGLSDKYSYTNMPAGDINKNHNDKALKSAQVRSRADTSPSPVTIDLKIKNTINKSDSRELSAGYEGKIKGILQSLIGIKDAIDTLCNTKEAKASVLAKALNTRKPITLKIDYPVISIVGGWKFGESSEVINKCEVQGSLSIGFNPLIKGEGAIDLLACLEIYPVAKAVIKAADLVLASVKGEIWFDIYAYGAVNLNGDIYFNKKDIADFQVDTVMGLGVRLGIKFNMTTKKVTFQGDKKEDVTLVGAELSGKGETSLKIKAKRGVDDEGVFIEAGVDFGGIIVFVTAKAKVWKAKLGVEDTPFVLVKPKPDILKKRMHII